MNTHTQNIVKNLDFSLRAHKSKSVVVISDADKEGKSTFIRECIPLLCELYERSILIYDCQNERGDILENSMSTSGQVPNFIHHTNTKGLDYIHADDIFFLQSLPENERISNLTTYFNEISKNYDTVIINTKTLKRADKNSLPNVPIDGAIIVRSPKSLSKRIKPLTAELKDRDIPILGLVMNGGI